MPKKTRTPKLYCPGCGGQPFGAYLSTYDGRWHCFGHHGAGSLAASRKKYFAQFPSERDRKNRWNYKEHYGRIIPSFRSR